MRDRDQLQRRGVDRLRLVAGVAIASLAISSCYLPRSDVVLPVERQVLVAVYQCSETTVGGEIINSNDVAVLVTLVPRWLDGTRVSMLETELPAIEVPAGETVEFSAEADTEIETPDFCEAEAVIVEES